jgi:hypothetical protein
MHLKSVLIEGGRGAIMSEKGNNEHVAGQQLLPFVFDSSATAREFLDACERSGVNIWPGMAHDDMAKLFRLWHDARKR